MDELKQQWEALQVAEREWMDNPNWGTASAFTDAFKRIRIGAVGQLLAENGRLLAVVEAAREIVALADTPQLARNWATDRLQAALATYEQAKGAG